MHSNCCGHSSTRFGSDCSFTFFTLFTLTHISICSLRSRNTNLRMNQRMKTDSICMPINPPPPPLPLIAALCRALYTPFAMCSFGAKAGGSRATTDSSKACVYISSTLYVLLEYDGVGTVHFLCSYTDRLVYAHPSRTFRSIVRACCNASIVSTLFPSYTFYFRGFQEGICASSGTSKF